jgi:cell division protein FtsI (penicillin-binding protein 3)
LILFGLVIGEVVYLQTAGSESLKAAGLAQRVRESVLHAQRGTIFARDGGELALSVPSSTIIANPKLVTDPTGTAGVLTSLLGLAPEKELYLIDAFTAKEKSFVYVARQVDDDVAETVMALNLAGVNVIAEDKRIMPSGEVGRSVLGRTDIDGVGTGGLERQYDDLLTGIDGERVREQDRNGLSIPGSGTTTREPMPGTDLVLTLDRSLQFQVEQALLARVDEVKAAGGTVVVMDTDTGEIYSIANVIRDEDTGIAAVTSANLAAVEAFEPGSVAKVFSLSAVVDSGVANPDTVIDVPGRMVFNRNTQWEQTVKDAELHDTKPMSLRDIIVHSSNIGTLLLTEQVGDERFGEYLQGFGFGQATALDFPDESAGRLKPFDEWQGSEAATMSYGYGYTTTSLQLAAAVNTVANGGTYVAPKMLMATIGADGEVTETPASTTRRVISPESAATMVDMMTDVVCTGTGKDARLDGITVAGKTGTAYKVQDGTYGEDGSRAYRASFVGFLPAAAPQVTILVTIDEPDPTTNDRFGGKAAAPLFATVATSVIHELAITPTPGDTGCAAR